MFVLSSYFRMKWLRIVNVSPERALVPFKEPNKGNNSSLRDNLTLLFCYRPTPPPVMWAQRSAVVFLTINLEDVKDPEIK